MSTNNKLTKREYKYKMKCSAEFGFDKTLQDDLSNYVKKKDKSYYNYYFSVKQSHCKTQIHYFKNMINFVGRGSGKTYANTIEYIFTTRQIKDLTRLENKYNKILNK